jgi:putative ABC transport system ATP-binding protein
MAKFAMYTGCAFGRKMPDFLVECRNLGRELSSSGQFLLRAVSLGLAQGEVLGIVGPSGAGKSTLLRLINRLDEPTEGTVFFHGRDYRGLPTEALRCSIGMVMQRAYLFPGTVSENIAFGPGQRGKSIQTAQIEALLTEVGLEGYASRDALTLSGGEAQRVAITRALANDPEVLLLDEPTSALDEASRESVERLLERLIRERHLTCFWVTHNPEQAQTMADRILVLAAGRTKALGLPDEVLSRRMEAADV